MRQVYALIFSSNYGRMKYERMLLDMDLKPNNGRWIFEFDLTVKDRIVPATIMLIHSSVALRYLEGARFSEIIFRDYQPDARVLEIAKTRLDETGTIYSMGQEIFSLVRNQNDKSKRRPSILL